MTKIVSRAEARIGGISRYFTGKPCKQGHICERYTYGGCIRCNAISSKAYYARSALTINDPRIVSLATARATGINRYFTGKPCSHGHVCERYTNNANCLQCTSMYTKARYARQKEKLKKQASAWAHQNRERVRHNHSKYYFNNREKFTIYSLNRHARKQNSVGTHSIADIRALFKLQRGRCAYSVYKFTWCRDHFKERSTFHVDHIDPLFKQGRNDRKNLQLLCAPCNLRKRHKDQTEFLQQYGVLL